MIPHVYDAKKDDESVANFHYERPKNIKWYKKLLLNRPLQVGTSVILLAVVAPLLIYRFYYFMTMDLPPSDGYSAGSCLVPREMRLPCGIGDIEPEECHPQCCYDYNNHLCFHRTPSRFSYIIDREWYENLRLLPRVATVPYNLQNSVTNLRLSIDEISETHLSLTFYNAHHFGLSGNRIENKTYTYEISSPEMNVLVNATQGTIFNTARGPLIASDNIWEIAFHLTNDSMYGLGELPLTHGTVKVLYNHDGDSSIPLIYARHNGSYHGLLIDIIEPTEVTLTQGNQIIVRSITNFGLKFHIFTGPHPYNIMEDATKVLNSNKQLEYWMLGAHICSEVRATRAESLEDLRSFVASATSSSLPYESHCGTAPITLDSNICQGDKVTLVTNGFNLIRTANRRVVPHVSPYIRYEEIIPEAPLNETESEAMTTEITTDSTTEMTKQTPDPCRPLSNFEHIIFRDPDTFKVYKGLVDDHDVVYPNYEDPDELLQALWVYNTNIDGVVLENTWPLDEFKNKTLNETTLFLPYFGENFQEAFNRTPLWNMTLIDNDTRYLFSHNKYGNNFVNAFQTFINTSIPIWSTTQRMNGDVAVNRQNVNTSWANLRRQLLEAALGGISGHRLWSSPVCGDTDSFNIDNHASLCVKWYMASTYLPLIKIHSKSTPRHPLAFVGVHRALIINALRQRLSLSPYFFTTLQKGPLLRPMFYQFPQSAVLKDISTQFSVGDDLLIVPNLLPIQSHVHVWMPPGTWYELWSGLQLDGEEGEAVTMTTTEADFLTLIRAGSVLALQKTVQTTAELTRSSSQYSLIAALDCDEYRNCNANGYLYMTENITIEFQANHDNLTITSIGDDFAPLCNVGAIWANTIREIDVYGLEEELNNYDHHLHVVKLIQLCLLQTSEDIVVDLR